MAIMRASIMGVSERRRASRSHARLQDAGDSRVVCPQMFLMGVFSVQFDFGIFMYRLSRRAVSSRDKPSVSLLQLSNNNYNIIPPCLKFYAVQYSSANQYSATQCSPTLHTPFCFQPSSHPLTPRK
jgi:hypothetical protein